MKNKIDKAFDKLVSKTGLDDFELVTVAVAQCIICLLAAVIFTMWIGGRTIIEGSFPALAGVCGYGAFLIAWLYCEYFYDAVKRKTR